MFYIPLFEFGGGAGIGNLRFRYDVELTRGGWWLMVVCEYNRSLIEVELSEKKKKRPSFRC